MDGEPCDFDERDPVLAREFFGIMHQPGAWPRLRDEAAAYQRERDAAMRWLEGRAQQSINRLRAIDESERES